MGCNIMASLYCPLGTDFIFDIHLVELSTNMNSTWNHQKMSPRHWISVEGKNNTFPLNWWLFSNPICFPRWFNDITLHFLVEMTWKQRWFNDITLHFLVEMTWKQRWFNQSLPSGWWPVLISTLTFWPFECPKNLSLRFVERWNLN